MKKLMITATVALCAAVGSQALESANVVGYTTREMGNTFKIAAAQFESTAGLTQKINDFVACQNPGQVWEGDMEDYEERAGWKDSAPTIQVPVASGGYNYYFYVSDARIDDTTGTLGWATSGGDYVTVGEIAAGLGLWIRGANDGVNDTTTFTFSGQVISDDSATISGDGTFRLRASPYPKATLLNGENVADWSVLTPGQAWEGDMADYEERAGWKDSAPQIQVPVASGGYNYYFYVTDARVDDDNGTLGWATAGGDYATTAVIPAGVGIWFKANTAAATDIEFYK